MKALVVAHFAFANLAIVRPDHDDNPFPWLAVIIDGFECAGLEVLK
jgi:hypothetical protein